MRLKIILSSEKVIKIPFNYNHILMAIIYNKINDIDYAKEIHDSRSFKYFTFSKINIFNKRLFKSGFISKDGMISFEISSPNFYLIKKLAEGFLKEKYILFQKQILFVKKVEVISDPIFKSPMYFYTISPIIIKKKKLINGKFRIWDLEVNDEFFSSLERNLIKKYNEFNNNYLNEDIHLKIYSEMNHVKRKRISINNHNNKTFHRAYLMDLIIEGDINLIKFAYDVGLGSKNSLGFGMINIDKGYYDRNRVKIN